MPAAVTPSEMLAIFGLTLMICGALSYQSAPATAKSISAIFMGNGGALISFLLSYGVRDLTVKKGDPNYKAMMVSVHLGFIFPLLFGSAIAWRLSKAWNNPAKAYLKPYFLIIIASALLTSALIYAHKPKKTKEADLSNTEEKSERSVPDKSTTTVRRRRRAAAM